MSTVARRPPTKRREIVRHLRSEIIHGRYQPGDRLPTRQQLVRSFSTGPATVQAAMAELEKAGFVESQASRGTRVSLHPPHLHQIGLVIPSQGSRLNWGSYWTALSHESRLMSEAAPVSFVEYANVYSTQCPEYDRLLEHVRARRLAGLLFPSFPHTLVGSELLDDPDVPAVAVSAQPSPSMDTLLLDNENFLQRGLMQLRDRGCRRPGLIITAGQLGDQLSTYLENRVQALGLEMPPYHICLTPLNLPVAVQRTCQLMMHEDPATRIDGLLIADDNLIASATQGLFDGGVRTTDDFPIVGHCNFPFPTPTHLPVDRLGFDIPSTLRKAVEVLAARREGALPSQHLIPALWEDELDLDSTRTDF